MAESFCLPPCPRTVLSHSLCGFLETWALRFQCQSRLAAASWNLQPHLGSPSTRHSCILVHSP